MAKPVQSDLQVTRALLSMDVGKLSPSEKRAFQGMYDNLMAGQIIRLSMRQRAWADEVYDKHNLDKERPAAKKIAIQDKSLLPTHPLDQLQRPLKPPGRR
jgi:hypothetical protein